MAEVLLPIIVPEGTTCSTLRITAFFTLRSSATHSMTISVSRRTEYSSETVSLVRSLRGFEPNSLSFVKPSSSDSTRRGAFLTFAGFASTAATVCPAASRQAVMLLPISPMPTTPELPTARVCGPLLLGKGTVLMGWVLLVIVSYLKTLIAPLAQQHFLKLVCFPKP